MRRTIIYGLLVLISAKGYASIITTNILKTSCKSGFSKIIPVRQYAALPDIDASNMVIKMSTCKNADGSITGLKGDPSFIYEWRDKSNTVVGNSIDLINIPYGYYTLTYTQSGNSEVKTFGPVIIKNTTGPFIDETAVKVTPGTCEDSNGSITGIKVTSDAPITYIWANVDTRNNRYQYDNADLLNIPPGRYRLQVYDDNICDFFFSSIYTVSGTGQIMVDASNIKTTDETCGQKNGSIKGFVIKNPNPKQKFTWTDKNYKQWGTSLDLTNVPNGDYTLKIEYDGEACPYTYGPIHLKNIGGPVIDESKVDIVHPFCGNAHANITGISVAGVGKISYTWYDNFNKVVSHEKDLMDVGANTYRLMVTDESGCGETYSSSFFIDNLKKGYPDDFNTKDQIVVPATCTTKGSVTGIKNIPFLIYTWRNELGEVVNNTPDFTNVPGGVYTLTVGTYCHGQYDWPDTQFSYDLGPRAPDFKTFDVTVNNSCTGQNSGSIKLMSDYTVIARRWVNSNDETVGTEDYVTNLSPGTYRLYLSNDYCEILYGTYVVDEVPAPSAPVVPDVQVCSTGLGRIVVTGLVQDATCRLYYSKDSVIPLIEQKGGIFNIQIDKTHTYYVSQLSGECESTRTPVRISVSLLATDIPNTFTPNGDGINDYWQIQHIEEYPKAVIKIFNRAGQQVFQSRGYANPFNGTYNGEKLEAGSYFYIISLSDTCNISGNLTIIR
ncbi:gliding motility-associated C-terminal domain-containing protein [Mucilaginibacter segetis]|uniref:Gliding motility-associated C-terminal domain-containing protein n=1 Tax=Mucilaginibacter segetis TaxID=2793071 RepID=A0A934ULI0_9SPHI|nr:gliding motility-associated C-terminal domain-containing protein [Mucilaginibacter segetis]MBK0377872.1 gliding motility-associated C-terminal domain-containing protein [Mucilaginibacter segetis]